MGAVHWTKVQLRLVLDSIKHEAMAKRIDSSMPRVTV